jgi:hypothetical protein
MPCFDGMHCCRFSMSESNVGALPFAVGDYVAARARMSCVSAGVPHDVTRHRGCAYSACDAALCMRCRVTKGDRDTLYLDVVHRLFVFDETRFNLSPF